MTETGTGPGVYLDAPVKSAIEEWRKEAETIREGAAEVLNFLANSESDGDWIKGLRQLLAWGLRSKTAADKLEGLLRELEHPLTASRLHAAAEEPGS